jgi:acetyl-CoA acetyltransferase
VLALARVAAGGLVKAVELDGGMAGAALSASGVRQTVEAFPQVARREGVEPPTF